MTEAWPISYLRPRNITRHLAPRTTAGTPDGRIDEAVFTFSEPIADGPTFVRANQAAIQAGTAFDAGTSLATADILLDSVAGNRAAADVVRSNPSYNRVAIGVEARTNANWGARSGSW